jgi:hypothetical protein
MIAYIKTTKTVVLAKAEESRFDLIRRAAAERYKKSDTDGTRRPARQTAEDNRLI